MNDKDYTVGRISFGPGYCFRHDNQEGNVVYVEQQTTRPPAWTKEKPTKPGYYWAMRGANSNVQGSEFKVQRFEEKPSDAGTSAEIIPLRP